MSEEKLEKYENHPLIEREYLALNELKKKYNVNFRVTPIILGKEPTIIIKKNHVEGISLPNLNLTEIPPLLQNFPFLNKLNLFSNSITFLPQWLSKMNHLTYLSLNKNHFQMLEYENLPPSIETIELKENNIKQIPQRKYQLETLKRIFLDGNQLETFPECLKDFTHLEGLILHSNPIKMVPDWSIILINLQDCRFNDCNLQEIPANLFMYKSLNLIDIENNQIRSVPKEIFALPKFDIIYLENNDLDPIPINDLSESELSKLSLNLKSFHDPHNIPQKLKEYLFRRSLIMEEIIKKQNDIYKIDQFNSGGWHKNVKFDCENITMQASESSYPKNLMGLQFMGGIPFLGISAGGDWEFPVFFVLHEREDKIEMYIPYFGNVYNKDTNQAFGNDDEADITFLEKELNTSGLKNMSRDRIDQMLHGLINKEELEDELKSHFSAIFTDQG